MPAPGLQQVRPPTPGHRQHHRHWHRHRGRAQDQRQGESPGTRQGQDTRSWGFISRCGTFIKSLAHKSARTNRNQLETLLISPGLDKTLGNILLLIAAFLLLAVKMENEEYDLQFTLQLI